MTYSIDSKQQGIDFLNHIGHRKNGQNIIARFIEVWIHFTDPFLQKSAILVILRKNRYSITKIVAKSLFEVLSYCCHQETDTLIVGDKLMELLRS